MRLERISSRVRSSGARSSISSSKVRLASSIIAHSSPRTSMPWPAQPLGVDEVRLVAELVDAERVGQPAGGIDGDDGDARALGGQAHGQRRRRRRLADAARARADDDALVAQARPHSAPSSSRARAASRSVLARSTSGSVVTGGARPAAQARAAARAARRARAWAWRAARTSGPSGAAASRRASAALKRWGSMPLQTTSSTSSPSSSRSASCSVERLVDRHLLGPRPRRRRRSARGSQSIASIVRPWRAIRPDARASGRRSRGALSTATPWPVAGASRTTRS